MENNDMNMGGMPMDQQPQPQPQQPMRPQMPSQPPMPPMPPMQDRPMLDAPKPSFWNLNRIFLAIAIVLIVILGVVLVLNARGTIQLPFLTSKDAVAKAAVDYLNKSVLQQGQTATLVSSTVESGVIHMNIKIGTSAYDSYVTTDGKLLFPQAINLKGGSTGTATGQNNTQQGAAAVDSSKVKTANEPFLGSATAPVTMALWTDYQCPFCKKLEQDTVPQIIKDYVNSGKVKIVFKDYQFLGADSQVLGKWGRAVWQLDAAHFYAWHKAIFDAQGTENTGWATPATILSITKTALGASMATQVQAAVKQNDATYQAEMDADKSEGSSFGITGTPGTIIGKQFIAGADAYSSFKSAIDTALSGK